MKWYLVLFSVFFTLPVFSQLRPTRITDSLSTTDQEAQLNRSLLKVDSEDPKKIAEALNRELKQMGLPTINTNSPDFKMTLALSRDFFSSHTVGAAFTDGENLFCLPCEKGMNSFESGIISLSKYQTNLFNMNKQRLTDLAGSCSYDLNKTSLVRINDSQVKKYICNVEANCTKKNGGNTREVLLTGYCLVNDTCPPNPIDCIATRSMSTISRGQDAIGNEELPSRAYEQLEVEGGVK